MEEAGIDIDLRAIIRNVVMRIVLPMLKVPVRTGVVSEVDTNENTCTVTLSTGAEVTAQFQSITQNNNGLLLIPADQSNVTIAMVEGIDVQWVIIKTSQVDSWSIFTNGGKIEVLKNGEVHLNGKQVNGQDSPLAEINLLKGRMNLIEQDNNKLKTAFSTWVVVPQDGGAALKVAAGAWFGTALTETQVVDLQNQKVYQGDGN